MPSNAASPGPAASSANFQAGISTKVLHRCINRLESEGFLLREAFDETPPRVEYRFSEDGTVLMEMIQSIRQLANRWSRLEPMEL